jgi:hypothetical protein
MAVTAERSAMMIERTLLAGSPAPGFGRPPAAIPGDTQTDG